MNRRVRFVDLLQVRRRQHASRPGIALALVLALGSKDAWLFGTVLAIFAVLTGLLMLTRPARLVLCSIRRRLTT
ncbi:hypothetical protein [Actinomadura sp. GTD37]|uniref:hypothetical protein n=1 Tax=Actinomadura sp. GTD37 TaxID=1778030 RepID=UPI0035BF238C